MRKSDLYEELNTVNALADPNLMKENLNKFSISSVNLHIVIDNNKFHIASLITREEAVFISIIVLILILLVTKFRARTYEKRFFNLIRINHTIDTILNITNSINEKDKVNILNNLNLPKNINEVSSKILDNIILYSANSIYKKNKYWQTKASFSIEHNTEQNIYILKSCNIVDLRLKNLIIQQYVLVKDLNQEELQFLLTERINKHKINSSNNKNLSMIQYAQYSNNNVKINFKLIKNDFFLFDLELKVEA
jgi:hypothetical protein